MAYQTSCASYTSGRVGLTSLPDVVADAAGGKVTQHGSAAVSHCLLCRGPFLLFGGVALARGV